MLVDNYIDETTLTMLSRRNAGVASDESREDFDELLLERSPRGTYWLHFAVRPPEQGNRRKIRFIQI